MSERKFAILIDSTGDLGKELRTKWDIDYCPMNISINDKEIVASLDYDQGYSAHDIYETIRGGTRVFTTMVPATVFQDKFTYYVEKGMDVLYIACSSGLSGSVNVGAKVAEGILAEHPEAKIVCFDALISGYAQGDMGITASKLRAEGKTLDEVVAYLTENRLRWNQFGAVETLTYLKQAGRVSASSAFFGNLFGVKPILVSDSTGHNVAVRKVKGWKAVLTEIAKEGVKACQDTAQYPIYIGQADNEAGAEFCKQEILKLAPNATVIVGPIGPIIGASTGPGTVAVYTFGANTAPAGE